MGMGMVLGAYKGAGRAACWPSLPLNGPQTMTRLTLTTGLAFLSLALVLALAPSVRSAPALAPLTPLAGLEKREAGDNVLQWDGNTYYVAGRPTVLFAAEVSVCKAAESEECS